MAGLSSLTWLTLIGPWGWVRLHSCYTLNNQCARVKPAISTHTLVRPRAWQRSPLTMVIIKPSSSPTDPGSECVYLWGEVGHADAPDQAQPLAQRLGLVQGQHGLAHLATVADGDVRHELHAPSHNGVTLARRDQTHAWGVAGRQRKAGGVRGGSIQAW